jgi:5-oxoprolinase (ATP-hydrolysing)
VPAELAALGEAARAALGGDPADIDVVSSVDCRYAGQSHELTVPSIDKFATEHRRRNGYELRGAPVEVVALRASARRASPMAWDDFAPASRRPAKGPCSLAEPDCTVWVPDGWRADVHDSGAWVLHR